MDLPKLLERARYLLPCHDRPDLVGLHRLAADARSLPDEEFRILKQYAREHEWLLPRLAKPGEVHKLALPLDSEDTQGYFSWLILELEDEDLYWSRLIYNHIHRLNFRMGLRSDRRTPSLSPRTLRMDPGNWVYGERTLVWLRRTGYASLRHPLRPGPARHHPLSSLGARDSSAQDPSIPSCLSPDSFDQSWQGALKVQVSPAQPDYDPQPVHPLNMTGLGSNKDPSKPWPQCYWVEPEALTQMILAPSNPEASDIPDPPPFCPPPQLTRTRSASPRWRDSYTSRIGGSMSMDALIHRWFPNNNL